MVVVWRIGSEMMEQWIKFGPGMYHLYQDGVRVAMLSRGFGIGAKWFASALTLDECAASKTDLLSRESGFKFCEFAVINDLETVERIYA
jgi:hypothetical protein